MRQERETDSHKEICNKRLWGGAARGKVKGLDLRFHKLHNKENYNLTNLVGDLVLKKITLRVQTCPVVKASWGTI